MKIRFRRPLAEYIDHDSKYFVNNPHRGNKYIVLFIYFFLLKESILCLAGIRCQSNKNSHAFVFARVDSRGYDILQEGCRFERFKGNKIAARNTFFPVAHTRRCVRVIERTLRSAYVALRTRYATPRIIESTESHLP